LGYRRVPEIKEPSGSGSVRAKVRVGFLQSLRTNKKRHTTGSVAAPAAAAAANAIGDGPDSGGKQGEPAARRQWGIAAVGVEEEGRFFLKLGVSGRRLLTRGRRNLK